MARMTRMDRMARMARIARIAIVFRVGFCPTPETFYFSWTVMSTSLVRVPTYQPWPCAVWSSLVKLT